MTKIQQLKIMVGIFVRWSLYLIIGGALIIGLLNMVVVALTKEETLKCNQLEKYSQEYSNFEYASWEKTMCGIE
jgi:hypothetical protein